MAQRTPQEVARALYSAGQLIELDAERSITAGSISGKGHIPSNPGEPPNADTRFLDSNIETEIGGPGLVTVTSKAPYSAALEYGSKRTAGTKAVRSFSEKSGKQGPILMEYGDSTTPARPFMRPATERNRRKVVEMVGDAVNITIRGS